MLGITPRDRFVRWASLIERLSRKGNLVDVQPVLIPDLDDIVEIGELGMWV